MRVLGVRIRIAPLLSAAVVVSLAGLSCESDPITGAAPGNDQSLYVPSQDDFRPEYDRDRANQRRQTWKQYWGWITSFYNGTVLSSGWSREAPSIVGLVNSEAKQKELIALVNDLGKRISSEWAKDSGVRQISTFDLLRWNSALNAARRAENGSGDRLRSAALQVRTEVARKLKEAELHTTVFDAPQQDRAQVARKMGL